MRDFSVPVSAMCFNEDQTKLFSFAKQFNELFETDMITGITRSLGMLKADKNIPMLVADSSGLYYYDNTLLVIPLNGECFYFIDLTDNEQTTILKNKYIENNKTSPMLIGDRYDVYLMYPRGMTMLHIDINKRIIEKIAEEMNFSAGRGYTGVSDFALYSTDHKQFVYFELNNKELLRIDLIPELYGFYIVGSNNNNVWYYHREKKKIYKCNKKSEKLAEYDFEYDASPYPILYEYNDKLFIVPLNGNAVYILDLKESTIIRHIVEDTLETEHRRFFFSKNGRLYFGSKEEIYSERILMPDCLVNRFRIFDVNTLSYIPLSICPENMEEEEYINKVNTAKDNISDSLYIETSCLLLKDYVKRISDISIQNNDKNINCGSIIHNYIKNTIN